LRCRSRLDEKSFKTSPDAQYTLAETGIVRERLGTILPSTEPPAELQVLEDALCTSYFFGALSASLSPRRPNLQVFAKLWKTSPLNTYSLIQPAMGAANLRGIG